MGDHQRDQVVAAAVNIFVILLLFVAAKALKKYADRLFRRQEQMTNDIMQRRSVFGRGLSDIPRGADTAAATPSNLYSSPPPEYTEIEFMVKPTLNHLPSYEDAVKIEEGRKHRSDVSEGEDNQTF